MLRSGGGGGGGLLAVFVVALTNHFHSGHCWFASGAAVAAFECL